jgi:hypothetical protein
VIPWALTLIVRNTGRKIHEPIETKTAGAKMRRDCMDLDSEFINEFGILSQDIQNNELQGKIQMFFRLIKTKVTQDELVERFCVKNADIDAAMENFKILGVAEEKEEQGLTTYVFKGYSPEMKEIASLFPERQNRLNASLQVLEQLVEKARAEGYDVDKYTAVINDVRHDFGIKGD